MAGSQTDPEVWRVIPSVPDYLGSNHGRVMRIPYLAPMPHGGNRNYGGEPTYGVWSETDRRFILNIDGHTHKVARMVCEAWHGPAPADKPVCMHLDEDSRNNRPNNLRWGTQKENLNFPGFLARTSQARLGRPHRKLTDEQCREIRRRWIGGEPQSALAAEYGVAPCTVSNIVNGRRKAMAA